MLKIRIEISARHVHFTRHDLEKIFGDGYELAKAKDLSQGGEFASTDTVILVGPKGKLEGVRIVGPCRSHTQAEVSRTDTFLLGCKAPLRLSGKVIRSGAVKIIGPKGELDLEEGLIVPKRHIHLSSQEAANCGLANGQNVKVAVEGPRALVFDEVEVRVAENYEEAIHLDTDEANAAGISGPTEGIIIVE